MIICLFTDFIADWFLSPIFIADLSALIG